MNDESFHTVYDCSRFRVIRWWCGAGGGGGPTDNFRVSSRSKVFCNSTEFFTDEFNFFQEGGGGHGPLDFFVAFRSESFIVFHIIHKTVVKNMCRK